MELLLIGGSGLLGEQIIRAANERDVSIAATYFSEERPSTDWQLDLRDRERTHALVAQLEPDVVLNAGAATGVDSCETNRRYAWATNARGAAHAATAADHAGAHYMYISTDYVFSGTPAKAPFTEHDAVSPCNFYGRTKFAGEIAAELVDAWTVLRTGSVFGAGHDNFVTWVRDALDECAECPVVTDRYSTPTYARDLAEACLEVALQGLTGRFHATGPTRSSRFDTANAVARTYELDPARITAMSSADLDQSAPRPVDSSLDSTKLYEAIGRTFRPLSEALEHMRAATRSGEQERPLSDS